MKYVTWFCGFVLLCCFNAPPLHGQSTRDDLVELVEAPGISGYEGLSGAVGDHVLRKIKQLKRVAKVDHDSLGNLLVVFEGTGPGPKRLIVAPLDEPGYVVSAITPDGYLRLQRLPQQSPQALFDALHFAQPVSVIARNGRRVPGVIAGLSVHLQPARRDAPKMDHLDDMYVDIGATSESEARQAGVDVLDPVFVERRLLSLSNSLLAGTAVGDRYGAAALLALARLLGDGKFSGTVTLVFVAQQWVGSRGLARILASIQPDEMIYAGRLPAARTPSSGALPPPPGSGVLIGVADPAQPLAGLAAEIHAMANESGLSVQAAAAGPLRFGNYGTPPKLPERFAHLAVPVDWPVTPIETLSERDVDTLVSLLERYVRGQLPQRGASAGNVADGRALGPPHRPLPIEEVLARLSEAYGASGHEAGVREEVLKLLPEWAKPETDASGNLILHFPKVEPHTEVGMKMPEAQPIVFVAHLDELGFQVKGIGDDGRLQVQSLGGGQPQYYFGHPVLLHSEKSTRDALIELPAGWDAPEFIWPSFRGEALARVDVGARNRAEAEALGIKPGDWITIEKHYRPLHGTRANARSFDDRVGCTALVAAVWALGQILPGRDVTFIWSTEEEVGLRGAAAAAERLNAAGRAPQTVFAIDTFVSSDSPLENKRFADALLGYGFVVRAVDNSNIVPRALADRVVALARQHNIPVQYGVTGGGNDGATFTRYGAVDVALGWPLRYSHSAAEVIDTRDVHALADIVTTLARDW